MSGCSRRGSGCFSSITGRMCSEWRGAQSREHLSSFRAPFAGACKRTIPSDPATFSLNRHDLPLAPVVKSMDSAAMPKSPAVASQLLARIAIARGKRVVLDSDLAVLYGVTTKRFNEAVKRNLDRFPADFSFLLEDHEVAALRSQIATSNSEGRGGRRYNPRVFTEHGAIMAAMVLNSARAVQMSVYVVRAFVELRQLATSNAATLRRLDSLERSVAALDAETRKQFDQVHEAILGLMIAPARKV